MQNAYASKNGYLDKAGFDVSTTAPVIAKTIKVLEVARAGQRAGCREASTTDGFLER